MKLRNSEKKLNHLQYFTNIQVFHIEIHFWNVARIRIREWPEKRKLSVHTCGEQSNSETFPVPSEVILFLISQTKIWPVFHAHIRDWFRLRGAAQACVCVRHAVTLLYILHKNGGVVVSWRQRRFVPGLRSPPRIFFGRVGSPRTSGSFDSLSLHIRVDRVGAEGVKKKRKKLSFRLRSLYTHNIL